MFYNCGSKAGFIISTCVCLKTCGKVGPMRVWDGGVVLKGYTVPVTTPAVDLASVLTQNPSDLGQSVMRVSEGKFWNLNLN